MARRAGRRRRRVKRAARRVYARAAGSIRRYRARRRAGPRHSLGLPGKVGLAVALGAPLVVAALDAGQKVMAVMSQKTNQPNILTTATIGLWRFINGLTMGYTGADVCTAVKGYNTAGTAWTYEDIGSAVPTGSFVPITVAGFTLFGGSTIAGWAARKLAKVKSVRFFGVKMA